jgi:lipopolysaccharide export system protein LptA
MIKSFAAAFFVWTMLFMGGAVQAQDQVPVKIISDKMDYDQENNTVIFTGNVHVDRSDFELWSDKLTVFMEAAPGGAAAQPSVGPDASRDIEKLLAEGKVRIKRENQLGTSDKATYWTKKGVIVMEGNPVLKDGEGSISGEVITYHVQENRGVVQGGEKQRVQAVFMAPADSFAPEQE